MAALALDSMTVDIAHSQLMELPTFGSIQRNAMAMNVLGSL